MILATGHDMANAVLSSTDSSCAVKPVNSLQQDRQSTTTYNYFTNLCRNNLRQNTYDFTFVNFTREGL